MYSTFLTKRKRGNPDPPAKRKPRSAPPPPIPFHVITPYLPSLLGLLLLASLFPGDGAALRLVSDVTAAVFGAVRYGVWLPVLALPLFAPRQKLVLAVGVAAAAGVIALVGGDGGQVGGIVARVTALLVGPLAGALMLTSAAAAILWWLLPLPGIPQRQTQPAANPGTVVSVHDAPPLIATATPIKRRRRVVDPAKPPVILPRPAEAGLPAAVTPAVTPQKVNGWALPTLPHTAPGSQAKINAADQSRLARTLTETLNAFGVPGQVDNWEIGPTITRYHFTLEQPPDGRRVKVSKILSLRDDLALALAASPVRIQAPVPGTNLVGIEAPNQSRQMVPLSAVVQSAEWAKTAPKGLAVALGQKTNGQPVVIRLDKAPHLLIAGATGSGKSVCLNTLMASLLVQHTPDTLRVLLTDPKQVELTQYNGLPHLLAPVVTDLSAIPEVLSRAVLEMEHRYKKLSELGVRDIDGYNAKCAAEARLPYIVLVLDEFGDVMVAGYRDEVEQHIARLASKARAAGIHLVLATQRPSVDVVTGLIKANFPARIAFAVTSQVDSRVILDQPGAETLLGKGDMLWMAPDKPHIERLQGAFVSDADVEQLVAFWQGQGNAGAINGGLGGQLALPGVSSESPHPAGQDDDAAFKEKAIAIAQEDGYLSVSLLQRRLRIGYNRAGRLIEALEADGVLAKEGNRRVLVKTGD